MADPNQHIPTPQDEARYEELAEAAGWLLDKDGGLWREASNSNYPPSIAVWLYTDSAYDACVYDGLLDQVEGKTR